MKSLRNQVYVFSVVLLGVLGVLMFQLAKSAFEASAFAQHYVIKNDLARAINHSAGWRAIERGLGSTIVGSSFDPSSSVGLAFEETCEKTDKEIRLALGYADELATRFPDPGLTRRVAAWRAGVQQLEADRGRIRTGEISEAEWIADATENIQDAFDLRDYVFAPTDQEDLVIHLNTRLGPNIATLAEFAGRERAIVGNAIASGRPLSAESRISLDRFRFVVDEASRHALLLKRLPSTAPAMQVAIQDFEDVFLGSFQQLREEVLAANDRIESNIDAASTRLEKRIAIFDEYRTRIASQVLTISRHPSILAYVRAVHLGEEGLRPDLYDTAEDHLYFYASIEQIFANIRFLDTSGMERLRVNNDADVIHRVAKDQLQDKGTQEYFNRTSELPAGAVYVSEMTLNIEHGEVEVPFNPVVRYATPITIEDETAGVMVLNLRGESIETLLHLQVSDQEVTGILVNQDGFYLHHSDDSKQWGMTEGLGRAHETVREDYPEAVSAILSGKAGVAQLNSGRFVVYSPFRYAGDEREDRFWILLDVIEPIAYPLSTERWMAEATKAIDTALKISDIVGEQADTVMADVQSSSDGRIANVTILLAAAVLLLVFFSYWAFRQVLGPIRSLTAATDAVATGDLAQRVPHLGTTEFGQLGESFNRMTQDLRESTAELREHRDHLDGLVDERTQELHMANEKLLAEIDVRTRTQARLGESLAEKEVLLKEIHHRVKNNLQIISSLLNLQSAQIEDDEVRSLFAESKNRVSTMALIHEKLYRSDNLARIDFGDYIRSLVDALSDSYGVQARPVTLEVAVEDVSLDIDTAIPCALIVNELVSNALKYAFRGDTTSNNGPPEIRVEMSRDGEDALTLRVSDNGCGLPKNLDFRNTESLGLQIVNTLTEQIDGVVELANEGGATFEIRIEAVTREPGPGEIEHGATPVEKAAG